MKKDKNRKSGHDFVKRVNEIVSSPKEKGTLAKAQGRSFTRSIHPLVKMLDDINRDKDHPFHSSFKEAKKNWKSRKTNGESLSLSIFGRDLSNRLVMRNFHFSRTIYDGAWAFEIATVGAGYAKIIELDDLNGYTDFTTLYDQYKIHRVDFKLIPRINVHSFTTAAVTATAIMPTIAVWFDPDDATAPALQGESLEVENALYERGTSVIQGHYEPQAAIAAYGGAFTQFASFDGWCDCTSDDIQWYALKAWVTTGGTGQTTFQVWDAYFTVHCEFRKVR